MSIERLPSGKVRARVMIDGVKHAATFATLEEANDWIVLTRARSITGGIPRRISLGSYAARWLALYDTAPTATRTFHRRNLNNHVLPLLGSRGIADITPTEISRLLNHVRSSVSAATADAVYRTCSALFNAAVGDDVLPRSPIRSRKHRPRRQLDPRVVLERAQAIDVLRQLSGWQRDTAFLQLALGARIGEVAGLTPHDVDLGRRRITIRRRYYRGTIRATKNHRLRSLELPVTTIPTVERLIDEAGDPEPIPPLNDQEHDASPFLRRWLIQTSTGRPPNNTAFDKALGRACVAAAVPHISSHGLRHTYVSWMIDEGHSADKIAFWIGDTPETVRSVYAHILEDSSAPAAAAIDSVFAALR